MFNSPRSLLFTAAILSLATFACPGAVEAINIATVLVGNAGNAADTRTMNDGTTGYGNVAYDYRIGKYEVTNDQYIEFLRDVASQTDPHALYDLFMTTGSTGGIDRTGTDGNYTFAIKLNMGNKPVTYVTFWDAARFANWLHNGQPSGPQSAATTESGAYTLNGYNGTGGAAIGRNPSATWFITNDDEWYKAAFYDPRNTAEGGPAGNDHYWLYATGRDTDPTPATANSVGDINNPGPNVVNYNNSAKWNGSTFGHVTTVGSAGPQSASYYGTFDQSGNVGEWNETNAAAGNSHRTGRGGSFGNTAYWQSAAERTWGLPTSYGSFRIASVLNPPGPNDQIYNADYNHNGIVDAADYTVWRDTLGSTTDFSADGNGNETIDFGDYQIWKDHFGEIILDTGDGALTTVPEPSTSLVLLSAVALIACARTACARRFDEGVE